ncbi:MAG: hypothetical protein JSR82_06355 [Verrucomicrobia bacterium]|nr:hypothetical protein [Verrucomicrobiota bacterium]
MFTPRWLLLLLALMAFSIPGCDKPQKPLTDEAANEQLAREWFQVKGQKDLVKDERGVGPKQSTLRLLGRLRLATERNQVTVEMQYRVQLAPGAEIVDFAAGQGANQDEARRDAFENFAKAVLNPIWSAYLAAPNAAGIDAMIKVGNPPRDAFVGPMVVVGSGKDTVEMEAFRRNIPALLGDLQLTPGRPHWCKFVYGQREGEAPLAEAQFDNEKHAELSKRLARLDWPRRKDGYLAKIFVLVR